MHTLHASNLVGAVGTLAGFVTSMSNMPRDQLWIMHENGVDQIKKAIKLISVEARRLELRSTLHAAKRLVALFDAVEPHPQAMPLNPGGAGNVSLPLVSRLEFIGVGEQLCRSVPVELYYRICLTLPVGDAELFEQKEPLFGTVVEEKFPSAIPEIAEAGKCLALDRPTACVMHLMRVLEVGLASLAAELGVPFARNWNYVLNEIQRVIQSIEGKKYGEEEEKWFSQAASHFRFVKNGWRNHAMHIRDRYSAEDARKIFESVRAFMQHLSTRLSEPEA
jgi:hypothetical protein